MTRREWALKVLGLDTSATEADMRVAYRDLVAVWHPDRYSGNERLRGRAEEMMKRLNAARDILRGADPGSGWAADSAGWEDLPPEPPAPPPPPPTPDSPQAEPIARAPRVRGWQAGALVKLLTWGVAVALSAYLLSSAFHWVPAFGQPSSISGSAPGLANSEDAGKNALGASSATTSSRISDLIDRLGTDDDVRYQLAESLPGAMAPLLDALTSREPGKADEAMDLVNGYVAGPDDVVLTDGEYRMLREGALKEGGVAKVSAYLGRRDVNFRAEAICCLGNLGDRSALPLIRSFLEDADSSVRESAKYAVKRITEIEWEPMRKAIDEARSMAKSSDALLLRVPAKQMFMAVDTSASEGNPTWVEMKTDGDHLRDGTWRDDVSLVAFTGRLDGVVRRVAFTGGSASGDWSSLSTFYFRRDGTLALCREEYSAFAPAEGRVTTERVFDPGGTELFSTTECTDLKGSRKYTGARAATLARNAQDYIVAPSEALSVAGLPFSRLLRP